MVDTEYLVARMVMLRTTPGPCRSRPAPRALPALIWQTGAADAIKGIDPPDFRATLDQGAEMLQAQGEMGS
jgi:hypothetical protein